MLKEQLQIQERIMRFLVKIVFFLQGIRYQGM